jgi:hypothetical protein
MEPEREKIMNDSRFERMEHHLKLLKDSNVTMSSDMSFIKTALVGNEFTGGVGVIHTIRDIKDRMDKADDEIALLKENLTFSKNIIKTIVGIISAYIVYLMTK